MTKSTKYALLLTLPFLSPLAFANSPSSQAKSIERQNEQRQQPLSQRIENKNQQRQQAQQKHLDSTLQQSADVKFDTASQKLTLPANESPCYPIHQIQLSDYGRDDKRSKFADTLQKTLKELNLTLPHCLGGEGIGVVMKSVQNQIIEQGYITTRVVAQEQDLRSGELKLTVILGKVNNTLVTDSSDLPLGRFTRLSAWTAMTTKKGQLLNVRDLEQSLENFKRIPTADANIEILPADSDELGLSDLKISYAQAMPFRLTLGLDDSGSTSTGKYQGTAALSLDHLLTANDLFYSSFTHSIPTGEDDNGRRKTYNMSFHYSIPFGYWLLSLNHSQNKYHQEVAGSYQNYLYSGTSRNQRIGLSYVLYRDSKRKTTLTGSLWARQSKSFIDDAEIEVQRRRTAGWEASIQHREYLDQSTLDLGVSFKRGTGARGALPAPEELFDEGTARAKIILANATFTTPFTFLFEPWQYQVEFNGQWNKTKLTYQDRFHIGGRYSVRGFDGELTLAGNRGWTLRNEVTWLISPSRQFYLGIDYGRVYQQLEDNLGNELMGAVIGLRGRLWDVNYDLFLGRPMRKPDGFRTSSGVAGFNLSYQF